MCVCVAGMQYKFEEGTVIRHWYSYRWRSTFDTYFCIARSINGKYYVVFDEFLEDYPLTTVDDPVEWMKHSLGTLDPGTVRLPVNPTAHDEINGDLIEFD